MTNRARGILMALIAAFMWGILAIGMKVAISHFDFYTISWFRFFFSLIIHSILLFKISPDSFSILKKPPIFSLFASFALIGNYLIFLQGVKLISPSNAQVMIQFAPLFLSCFGILFFKESLSPIQFLGQITAILGFYLYYVDSSHHLTTNFENHVQGNLWVLLAALCFAVYAAFQKLTLRKFDTKSLNLIIFAVPSLILLPLVNFESILGASWQGYSLLLFLGLNTIIAYTAFSEALKFLPTPEVSMIVTLNPLLTIFIMTVLYYLEVSWIKAEKIEWLGFLGALLVVIGVILVVRKKRSV